MQNEKWKKQLWVFYIIKYGKFGSVSPGHFIKHKPLISEECMYTYSLYVRWFFHRANFKRHGIIKYVVSIFIGCEMISLEKYFRLFPSFWTFRHLKKWNFPPKFWFIMEWIKYVNKICSLCLLLLRYGYLFTYIL